MKEIKKQTYFWHCDVLVKVLKGVGQGSGSVGGLYCAKYCRYTSGCVAHREAQLVDLIHFYGPIEDNVGLAH